MEKDGQRGLLIASHKSLGKKTLMGHNSWGGGHPCPCTLFPRKPGSRATPMPNPHRGGAAAGKDSPESVGTGRFGPVRLSAALQTVACQASPSGRRVLQARILGRTGQYWLTSLLEHYIPCCPRHHLPYLVLPEPLRPKQLH